MEILMNITRKRYLERISYFYHKPVIKIITGMRRVGKSYFLKQIISNLTKEQNIDNSLILFIDKENLEFDEIQNYKDLYSYVEKYYRGVNGKKYLLIDEVQEIKDWEKAIISFNKSEDYDIYLTGSNAHLLSSELATLISGRYVEINILPLVFSEYLLFVKQDFNKQKMFNNFLRYGGLPGIFHLQQNDEVIFQYLEAIYNTILLKDIVKRYQVRNVGLLEKIGNFIFDNIGNLVTAHNIAKYLKSQNYKSYSDTVSTYLNYFNDTFLFYKTPRFDLKGKKLLELNDKYYVNDLGLKHALLGYKSNDIAQNLENIVYLELLYRGYRVKIGVNGVNEIDFIAEKQGKLLYIQVCYLLAGEKTAEREFKPLLRIKDNYPKYVLSLDDKLWGDDYKGIKRLNIIDFLLEA